MSLDQLRTIVETAVAQETNPAHDHWKIANKYTLKGRVSRDFRHLLFFMIRTHQWPTWINRLKCFRIIFRFCREIRSHSCLRSDTAESKKISY